MFKPFKFVRSLLAAGLSASMLMSVGIANAQPKQVKIGTINIVTFSPVYVAKELGYFKDEGLDVELFEATGGSALNAALLSGSVQASASGFNQPFMMAEQGKVLKSIVGMEMASSYVFLASPKLNIPADNPKAMAEALRGKRFGVASIGSGGHMVAEGILSQYGVSPKDVSFISVGTGAAVMAALKAGAVDAANPVEPDPTVIEASGAASIVLDLRNTKAEGKFSRLPTSSVQATSEWVEKNPQIAASIVKAIDRANNTIRTDAASTLRVYAKLYPNLSPENLKKVYETSKVNFKSAIPEEQYTNTRQVYLERGLIKKSMAYDDLVATQFKSLWK